MRKSSFAVLALAGMFVASQQTATATIITFHVSLSGTQEVPPNASTATGVATITVDDVAATVFVDMSFTGLTGGNALAAHIHCCGPANVSSPVVIPFTSFPTTTSGTYTNTFTSVSVTNLAGLEAYQGYINIHNTVFPGGEIRAQITPEPATVGMLALGLAGFALRRLRRR